MSLHNQKRNLVEALSPEVVGLYGQFTTNGVSAPIVPTGALNNGIASVVRTGVGTFTITLSNVGQKLINADAWTSGVGLAVGTVALLGAYTAATKSFTLTTGFLSSITSPGAYTAIDPGTNTLVWLNFVFSDADYNA